MSDTAPVCQPLTGPVLLFGVSAQVLIGFMICGFVITGYNLYTLFPPMALAFLLVRRWFDEDPYTPGSWLEQSSFTLSRRERFEP